EGVAVLLSSHNMAEVEEVCDGVSILESGRIAWDGPLERLRAGAPAAAYRLETGDETRTLRVARAHPGVELRRRDGGHFLVRATDAERDAFVVALGRAGIPIRELERELSPLEALFADLSGNGGPPARAALVVEA